MSIFQILKQKFPINVVLTWSGLIFVLLLSWFYLSPSFESHEGEQVHGYLQTEFQSLVSNLVIKKHPEVEKIVFHSLSTKNEEDSGDIKIFFTYSLWTKGDARSELVLEGEALLQKEDENFWLVQDFQVTDSFLKFSEPLLIKAHP